MDSDEIKAIMDNKYILDCTQMILNPRISNTSLLIHQGPGLITQSIDGSFSLKMFCTGDVSPQDIFSRLDWKAGELVHEEYYYRLSATDTKGREWEAEWVMPDIQARYDTTAYIVTADIRELSYSSDLPKEVTTDCAAIYFPGDIDIPFNTATSVEKIVAGEQRLSSTHLNIAKFHACNFDFEIEKEASWLTLKAYADSSESINDAVIMRFNESLQFVLARSLSWQIVEVYHGRTSTVRVRSYKFYKNNLSKSRIQPPVQLQLHDHSIWILFSKYLSYVVHFNEVLWHPIFRWIHAVIESGCSSIDTEALILSVAIEGLLKEEYQDLCYRNKELEAQIEKAKHLIMESDLEESFKNRLLGSLRSMLKPRAKDHLHILKDMNLIDPYLLEEYDKQRNSSAHGELISSSEYQVHLDRCYAVLVLFYHLIFLLIGYTGQYTDYSKHSFPAKEFKSTLAKKCNDQTHNAC